MVAFYLSWLLFDFNGRESEKKADSHNHTHSHTRTCLCKSIRTCSTENGHKIGFNKSILPRHSNDLFNNFRMRSADTIF